MTTPPTSPAIRAALRGFEPSAEQWDAITAPLQPQCIVAGAGSGKTAVMTARIVWLVESGTAESGGVLGLTFTNKASAELEERLTQALGALHPHPPESPTVLTYHAFAAQIVREHGARLGIAGDAAVLSEAQKWQMLLALVDTLPSFDELELRHPLSFIPQTLGLSEQCSHHLVTPEALAQECTRLLTDLTDEKARAATRKRRDFCAIVRAYIDAKRRAGRIDFGDQITLAVDLLREFADVAAGYRERYPVVLLDEYQDTNPAQKRLLQLVCPPGSAVTAVGDARQAIYAWRGATMFNLINFARDFPRADGPGYEPTPLAANYRSGRRIVALANSVIESVPAERRPGRELEPVAANGEGNAVAALFADQDAEAGFVADTIERLREQAGLQWRDFAILVRKRRYMDHIAATLERRDIPYEIPEIGGLLKVPPVIDAVAWLRVIADPGPSTNRWAARILLGPAYRIHYRDLAPVARWAAERNYELTKDVESLGILEPDPGEIAFSLLEALEHANEIADLSAEARERIARFLRLRNELRSQTGRPLAELAQVVVDRTGIAATLASSPSRSAPAMLRNVQTFVGVCGGFSPVEGEPTLATFLDYLDAAEESDDAIGLAATAPSDSVKVMTVHAAKGLEFEVVFLPVMASEERTNRDGWRSGSVFPDVRASDPFGSAQSLPNTIRDDAEYLPRPDQHPTRVAYIRALKDRALEDERRLLYVAVTRAKRRLVCTAAHWYGSESRKGPSVFLEEIAAHDAVEVPRWDDAPETNPLLARMTAELTWPPKPRSDDDAVAWIARVEALREGRLTEDEVLALGGADASEHLREHVRTVERLRDGSATPVLAAPGSLGATDAVRIALGKTTMDAVAWPLPERPTDAQRLGIEVHAWIEEQARGLTGLADQEALDAASLQPDRETVARLRASFAAMGYENRTIARLDSGDPITELPFTLKVGATLVRGRIDAVYETGEPGVLEVVDFKTGIQPSELDRGQLELYAEALAELGIVRATVRLTYAYLATGVPVSWTYRPRGLRWLEDRLERAASGS